MPGKAEGYPIGSRADWCFNEQVRVGWFSNLDHALHARKGNILGSLAALGSGSVGYRFEQQSYTIEDFLARERVTGLLLIKDGQILIERKQYDRNRVESLSFARDGEVDRKPSPSASRLPKRK